MAYQKTYIYSIKEVGAQPITVDQDTVLTQDVVRHQLTPDVMNTDLILLLDIPKITSINAALIQEINLRQDVVEFQLIGKIVFQNQNYNLSMKIGIAIHNKNIVFNLTTV